MKALDYSIPWGRPAEDVVASKRHLDKHMVHRRRIDTMRSSVDSSGPTTKNMVHLKQRLKKRQLVEDRRQQIAFENSKLMEKMGRAMREGTSVGKAAPPKAVTSLRASVYQRQQMHIFKENQRLYDRLKNQKPFISSKKLQREHEEQERFKRNISKSYQRSLRAKKTASMASTLGSREDSAYSMQDTYDYGSLGTRTMSPAQTLTPMMPDLQLRTARQVRAYVQEHYGDSLASASASPGSGMGNTMGDSMMFSPGMPFEGIDSFGRR